MVNFCWFQSPDRTPGHNFVQLINPKREDLQQGAREPLGFEHDQTGPSSTNPSASWAPVAHPSMVRPLKCYVPRYAVDQIPWVPTWALRLVASDSDASSFGLELEDKKCSKLVRLKTLSLSLSLSLSSWISWISVTLSNESGVEHGPAGGPASPHGGLP